MHRKLTTLLVTLLLTSGCGPLGTVPDRPPINWPDALECVPTEAIIGIIDRVTDVLFSRGDGIEITDDGKAELEDLAREHGPSTVACAVHEVVKSADRPGAAANADRMQASLRGRDFLHDEGIAIMTTDPTTP